MKINTDFIFELNEEDLNKVNHELKEAGIDEKHFNAFYCFFDVFAYSKYTEEMIREFKKRFCGVYYCAEDFVAENLSECYDIPDFLECAINYSKLVTMLETGGDYSFYEIQEGCAVFTQC